MKRCLVLLLTAAMLCGLCACGGSQTAPAGTPAEKENAAQTETAPAPAPEPTPEKNYVKKSAELLVREMTPGLKEIDFRDCGPVRSSAWRTVEYSYDEFGARTEETTRWETEEAAKFHEAADHDSSGESERDEEGRLISVRDQGGAIKYNTGFVWQTENVGFFEDGVLTRAEHWYAGNLELPDGFDHPADEITMEYHANGAPYRETTESWIVEWLGEGYLMDEPLVSIREFDEAGRCTRWRRAYWGVVDSVPVNQYLSSTFLGAVTDEYRWSFDEAGRPVTMSFTGGEGSTGAEGAVQKTEIRAEMQYDAEGRMSAAVKTVDGVAVNYRYEYGEDGRLAAVTREGDAGTLNSTYEYNDDGLLTTEYRTDRTLRYTWETGNLIEGSIDIPYSERNLSVFRSDWCFLSNERDGKDAVHRNVLQISAIDLEPVYVEYETNYTYETRGVLTELAPGQEAADAANRETLSAYYPKLGASLCGLPVPTPNGSERLSRIVTSRDPYLDVVSECAYGEDGALTQITDRFDPVGTVSSIPAGTTTTDDLGRLAEYRRQENWTIRYRYGEDPDSYTRVNTFNGDTREYTVTLDNERPTSWIGRPPEEAVTGKVTLNGDGLIERIERLQADGTSTVEEYEYRAERYADGSLKAVARVRKDLDFITPFLEFDEAGYLCFYRSPDERSVRYYYE